MTAVAVQGRSKASPALWIGMLIVAAGIVLLAFVGDDENTLGGRNDPNGFGREGLAGLRVMIERSGGVVDSDATSLEGNDVAILARNTFEVAVAFGASEESVYGPMLDWVRDGGTLITAVPVPGGPRLAFSSDSSEQIDRNVCTIDRLAGVNSVATIDGYSRVVVEPGDRSCFGDDQEALVVSRPLGAGTIIRVGEFEPFVNQVIDELDNGALAARLVRMGAAPAVAFLQNPDPAIVAGGGGPVNEDGTPVGQGDATLLDLIPRRVLALILGLAASLLLYVLARGRRLGEPVEEPLPIELPSSSYTEAVGRLYERAADPRGRSASILRHDFRATAARRVGLPANAPTKDLAGALELTTGVDPKELTELLDGAPPTRDDELVVLASTLADHRARMTRGVSAESRKETP